MNYFYQRIRKFDSRKISAGLLTVFLISQIMSGMFLFIPSPKQARAVTKTWEFTTSSDYTFDDTKIEFSSGQAQLKETSDWYNTSWSRRKSITITGSADGAQTNYQLKVTVTYDSDMQADFDDIRFTSSDGVTLIDYWLESKTDSTTADFWVEVPSILASPSETTIYLYYNNSDVSSVSSGVNTFISGTDFNQDDSFSYNEGYVAEDYGDQTGNIKSGVFTNGIGETWDSQLVLSNGRLDTIEYLGNGVLLMGSRTPDPGHIYVSTDYGDSWVDKGAITGTDDVTSIKSAGGGVAYILTGDSYFYKTVDYGNNWENLGKISNNTTAVAELSYGLIVLDSGTMLVSDTTTGGGHVFRSTNSGEDWTDLGVISTAELYRFEETGDGVVLNGWAGNIYKSTNDGVDWVDKGQLIDSPLYATEYLGNGIILQGADSGNVFRSIDNGENWTNLGVIGANADDFVYLGNNIIVFSTTCTNLGILYLSTDNGLTWSSIGSLLSAGDSLDHEIYVNDNGYEFGIGVTNKGYVVKSITGTPKGMVKKIDLDRTANSSVKKQLTSPINTNFAVRTKVRTIGTDNNTYWLPVLAISTIGERGCSANDNYSITLVQLGNLGLGIVEFKGRNVSPCYSTINQLATSMNTDYIIEIRKTAATTAEVYIYNEDGTLFGNNSLTINDKNYNYLMAHQATPAGWASGNSTQNIDYIFLRNYTSNEPTSIINVESTLYDITYPSINPNASIAQTFTSLSGFSETATKNGGEIKYQLSNDGGTTWYWYNSGWAEVSLGYAEANTATDINSNISSFPEGSGSFLFKAYFNSNGAQLVQLDSIELVGSPLAPTIGTPSARSSTSIRWNFTDNADDETGFKLYDSDDSLVSTQATADLGYVDETGLSENTQYSGRYINAYNSYGNSASSTAASAVYTLADTPTNLALTVQSTTQIDSLVDTFTNHSAGSSGYYFANTTAATNSDWQASDNSWSETDLSPNTQYTYTVKYRNGNSTETSTIESSKYTLIQTPSGITFDTVGVSSLTLSAAGTLSNLTAGSSGLYFDEISSNTGGSDSGWTQTNSYEDTGLAENTQYSYRVKVKNGDGTETSYTSASSKYTLADTPTNLSATAGLVTMSLTVDNFLNDTSGSAGYYFVNTTKNTNSGWIQTNSWREAGLICGNPYTYTVKYRNGDGVETSNISTTKSTDDCVAGGGVPISSIGSGIADSIVGIGQTKSVGSINDSGINALMYINSQLNFIATESNGYNLSDHTLLIKNLDMINKAITVAVNSNPIIFNLAIGEEKLIDLDSDNQPDIKIVFNDLVINRIDLTISQITSSESEVFRDNDLVKEFNKPEVYLIKNGQKCHIFNEQVFVSLGFSWNDIIETSNLNNYPLGEVIKESSNQFFYSFPRTLKIGDTGEDVKKLQQFLNSQGFKLAEEGFGSPNNETEYFGSLTEQALIKFQEYYRADILTPIGLTSGTGFFGSSTIKFINSL